MYESNFKRWIPYVIIGILVIALGLTFFVFRNKAKKQQAQIDALNQQVEELQNNMQEVYVTSKDVKSGSTVELDSVTTVLLPSDSIPENAITAEGDLTDKIYKIGLKAGSYITSDMISDYKVSKNMRELDVVMDEIPVGLEEGDYVDVRISFPLGQDYIAMSHKKVLGITGNTVKLIVVEHDFYRYESMKTDMATYQSTKVYGVKYVEAGLQKKGKVYYPPTLDIIKQSILDPNMDSQDFMTMINSRELLEEQLAASKKVDKNQTVKMDGASKESIPEYCFSVNDFFDVFSIEDGNKDKQAINDVHEFLMTTASHNYIVCDVDTDMEDERTKKVLEMSDCVLLVLTSSIKNMKKFVEAKPVFAKMIRNKPVITVLNNFDPEVCSKEAAAAAVGITKKNVVSRWHTVHVNKYIPYCENRGKLELLIDQMGKRTSQTIMLDTDINSIARQIIHIQSEISKQRIAGKQASAKFEE